MVTYLFVAYCLVGSYVKNKGIGSRLVGCDDYATNRSRSLLPYLPRYSLFAFHWNLFSFLLLFLLFNLMKLFSVDFRLYPISLLPLPSSCQQNCQYHTRALVSSNFYPSLPPSFLCLDEWVCRQQSSAWGRERSPSVLWRKMVMRME